MKPRAYVAKIAAAAAPIVLAKQSIVAPKPQILAIGSSTGGPQGLFELFSGLMKVSMFRLL